MASVLLPREVVYSKARIVNWNEGEEFPYNKIRPPGKKHSHSAITVAILDVFVDYPELALPTFISYFPESLAQATAAINAKLNENLKEGQDAIALTAEIIRERYSRLTYHYRSAVLEGRDYYFHNEMKIVNDYCFIKEFVLFEVCHVRKPVKYKFEGDTVDISFTDYLKKVNVKRRMYGKTDLRSQAREFPLAHHHALSVDPPIQPPNFMTMEQAMDMPFEDYSESEQPESNGNVEMDAVVALEDVDYAFLQQFLSLDDVTKKKIRDIVAKLSNPSVVVEKIPKI